MSGTRIEKDSFGDIAVPTDDVPPPCGRPDTGPNGGAVS